MPVSAVPTERLAPTHINKRFGRYSVLSAYGLPLIPLGRPGAALSHWLIWATYHSLGLWLIAALVVLLVNHNHQQGQQMAANLAAPKVWDVYVFEKQGLSRALGKDAAPGYQVLQVKAVDPDTVTFKVSSVTYKRESGTDKAISMDNLMLDSYFLTNSISLERQQLAPLFAQGTIISARRPEHIYIDGGIVRPRPKPKPLYEGPKLNQANQKGIEYFRQGLWTEALSAFQRGAEQGDAWSQYNLGDMYLKGQSTEQDTRQACLWFKKAAEQNHPKAKIALKHCS